LKTVICGYCRHATDGISGSWNVYRFNKCEHNIPNYGGLETHGTAAGTYVSARGFEAYNNTIIETLTDSQSRYGSGETALRIRDGSCFIFNNNFTSLESNSYAYFLLMEDESGGQYQETYGSDMFIWDNAYVNCTFLSNTGGYVENTHYFLRAPSSELDGFTYTPYEYPHPLTLETMP